MTLICIHKEELLSFDDNYGSEYNYDSNIGGVRRQSVEFENLNTSEISAIPFNSPLKISNPETPINKSGLLPSIYKK